MMSLVFPGILNPAFDITPIIRIIHTYIQHSGLIRKKVILMEAVGTSDCTRVPDPPRV